MRNGMPSSYTPFALQSSRVMMDSVIWEPFVGP
jgi:hypothetical protein